MFKKRQAVEKTYILLFLLVLFVPATGILRGEYNARQIQLENRTITPRPEITQLAEKNFYVEAEKWFGDRFLGRKYALDSWSWLHAEMGVSTAQNAVIGKDGWLFYRNILPCPLHNPAGKLVYLKNIQDYCEAHGAKFLLLVPPNKEYLYPEYYPAWLKGEDYKKFQDEAERLLQSAAIKELFLAETLQAAKPLYPEGLYFKDDHHWNYYGSLIGSQKLLETLAEAGVDSERTLLKSDGTSRSAFREGSLARDLRRPYDTTALAPWNKDFTAEIYEQDESTGESEKIEEVVSNDRVWVKGMQGTVVIENKATASHTTLLVIGDSYSGYMLPYITQAVRRVVFINHGKKANKQGDLLLDELIARYRPDAVIYQILGSSFYPGEISHEIIVTK